MNKIYSLLVKTKERALAFPDKYAEAVILARVKEFDNILAQIGETLKTRFELEDISKSHMVYSQSESLDAIEKTNPNCAVVIFGAVVTIVAGR